MTKRDIWNKYRKFHRLDAGATRSLAPWAMCGIKLGHRDLVMKATCTKPNQFVRCSPSICLSISVEFQPMIFSGILQTVIWWMDRWTDGMKPTSPSWGGDISCWPKASFLWLKNKTNENTEICSIHERWDSKWLPLLDSGISCSI